MPEVVINPISNIVNEVTGQNRRNQEEWQKRKKQDAEAQQKAFADKQAADDAKTDRQRLAAQQRRIAAASGTDGPNISPLGSLGSTIPSASGGGKTLLGG